jgi:hypothetical protein
MVDYALNEAERIFFSSLNRLGVRYLIVGMSSALIQGAHGSTQDIDIWFEKLDDPRIGEAAKEAGGFWISGSFGMRPPALGGKELSARFDIVTHMHGLTEFDEEYRGARKYEIEGVEVHVLPLVRVIESKKASGRPKDLASISILEEALAAVANEMPGSGDVL